MNFDYEFLDDVYEIVRWSNILESDIFIQENYVRRS